MTQKGKPIKEEKWRDRKVTSWTVLVDKVNVSSFEILSKIGMKLIEKFSTCRT